MTDDVSARDYVAPWSRVAIEHRAEADAGLHFEGDDDEPVRGTKFVIAAVRAPETHVRFILDAACVPMPGHEAEVALDCFRRVAHLAPGAQGVAYDMAFRGAHNQELYQLGLIPIDRVAVKHRSIKTATGRLPRVPKDSHVEDVAVVLRDGTPKNCRVSAVDGTIGLGEIDDKGVPRFVHTPRADIDRKANKRGGYRWYSRYEIPVQFGGGGSFTIRLDQLAADTKRRYNRTENVRAIPYLDDDFKSLFDLRKDAESINRGLEDTLYLNRAHSFGHARQQVDLLGFALMVNSLARHLAARRAGPKRLAA